MQWERGHLGSLKLFDCGKCGWLNTQSREKRLSHKLRIPFEDAPGHRKKGSCKAGKVSAESWEGSCCDTVVRVAAQYGVKGW